MNIHLLIHNFLYAFTTLLSISVILFIFFKVKRSVEKTTLILAFIFAIGFVVSHAWGVSVSNGELSRKILMFNLVNLFLPIFTSHCIFAFIGKLKEQKYVIISAYVISTSLLIFFLIHPHYFLLTSVPKMYFPNYYVAGPYYYWMLILFFLLVVYSFWVMKRAYVVADNINKNRIKYFAFAMLLAYLVGSIDFLLIYNIAVDPLWAAFFIPLFTIPFTYAIIHYELMDIRVIAKKAFVYIGISAIVGFTLVLLNYINNLITKSYPEFPFWTSSVILACITSVGLLLVWRKIRESDYLKYEFIDVITHKFRTPLTAIKWSSESLMESAGEGQKEEIRYIQKSANNLVDLTNLLANLTITDEKNFGYDFIKLDLNVIIENLISESTEKAKVKNITLSILVHSSDANYILADKQKMKFVFLTLLDNAISYTREGGKVHFEINTSDEKNIIVKVIDTGIGIQEEDIKHIFTKFYRTDSAKKVDTEGMGIGLYLTQKIVEKHEGKIWVSSEGNEKGTTFYIELPIYKK